MISALINDKIRAIKLKVLVFGPSLITPKTTPLDPLQQKRLDICVRIKAIGHEADMPEDLVAMGPGSAIGNPILQEILLIEQYDMVVMLVEKPGSILELGLALKPAFASKTQAFLRTDYRGGLVDHGLQMLQSLGGRCFYYTHPADLVGCHLLTSVITHIEDLQVAKYLS